MDRQESQAVQHAIPGSRAPGAKRHVQRPVGWLLPPLRQARLGQPHAGGCLHRVKKALFIWRHDGAGCIIHKWLNKHARNGGAYTILDMCKRSELASLGADEKRIPAFMLPGVDADTRSKLRPDILRIVGLPTQPTEAALQAATRDKGPYTIQVIEVGYCDDTRWREKLAEKRSQHAELRRLLALAGWQVDENEFIILLGTAGTVYKQSLTALQNLGMPTGEARQLLRELHMHAVLALQKIVATRRRLEHEECKAGVG